MDNKLISERNTQMITLSILFDILNKHWASFLWQTAKDLQEQHPRLRLKQYLPALKSVSI